MNKKNLPFAIFAAALVINLVYGFTLYSEESTKEDDKVESVRVFVEAVSILRKSYVDEEKVQYNKLVYAALRGMLEELDKSSRFHDPRQNKSIKEDTQGSFAGIGVTLDTREKNLKVNRTFPDGPADKAGIISGDVIITVDGVDVTGMDYSETQQLIRGGPNTEVVLGILRDGKTISLKVIRDLVTVPSVTRARVLSESNIGYVYIRQFNQTTGEEFEEAVDKLKEENDLKGLIVDLRGNPGGMLTTAVEMCSFFLNRGDLVIYTQGRSDHRREDHYAEGGTKYDMPLVILIDGSSASASEILSACLHDYGQAVLVGEKSYGKGSVQQIVDLRDGSSIRFTVAKYYTKSGKPIHGVGISPDVKVEMSEATYKEVYTHLNELLPTEEELDDMDAKDEQLKAAAGIINELLADESSKKILEKFNFKKDILIKKYGRTESANEDKKEPK